MAEIEIPGQPAHGGDIEAEGAPGQKLIERMLALRGLLVKSADALEDVLESITGTKLEERHRPGLATEDQRRFFPAAERLVADLELQVKRISEGTTALDKAF